MLKKRNLIFLSLLILGIFLISGCFLSSPVLVTFDSMGGSAVGSQTVEDGGLVTEPTAPTKTGYTFGGWYKESGCTNAWDFANDTVTVNVTLFAKWIPSATYSIGDIGPAGGYIFYDKGGYSDGWRFLEAAPLSTEWTEIRWGSMGTLIGGTETGIGAGQNNTTTIVTSLNSHSETNRAAQLCNDLTVEGYMDWFLPSKDELNLMYTNLKVAGVGGFTDVYYWSSSDYDASHAWLQDFNDGNQYYNDKDEGHRVRAVRAF